MRRYVRTYTTVLELSSPARVFTLTFVQRSWICVPDARCGQKQERTSSTVVRYGNVTGWLYRSCCARAKDLFKLHQDPLPCQTQHEMHQPDGFSQKIGQARASTNISPRYLLRIFAAFLNKIATGPSYCHQQK